jgi:uncharacterized protein
MDHRKHDMSIDEILKSIKGIIDNNNNAQRKEKELKEDVLELVNIADKPQSSNFEGHSLRNSIADAPKISRKFAEKSYPPLTEKEHSSYDKSPALESLVIKPPITAWLNANLPSLVKQILEKELSKK